MPVGLYTRKGKNGRTMYFRDGKLISKKSYTASRGRSRKQNKRRPSTRRGRSTGNPRRKNNMARYRRPSMPHPSVTGMAAGLSVASYLNAGKPVGMAGVSVATPGVIKDVLDSKLAPAFGKLASNAVSLINTPEGKTVLTGAIVTAAAGGIVRKWFPSIKLGGQKIYLRI